MKKIVLIYFIFIAFLWSCTQHRSITSKEFLWNDVNSLISFGEDYRLFYIDSSLHKKQNKFELDSNIIRKNISILDEQVSEHLKSIKQFRAQGGTMEYHFYVLDTISINPNELYLLLFEQCYIMPPSYDYASLILANIKKDSILSIYKLAEDLSDPPCHDVRSSILTSSKIIISKNVSYCVSDSQDEDGKPLGIGEDETDIITEYLTYNEKYKKFFLKERKVLRVKKS